MRAAGLDAVNANEPHGDGAKGREVDVVRVDLGGDASEEQALGHALAVSDLVDLGSRDDGAKGLTRFYGRRACVDDRPAVAACHDGGNRGVVDPRAGAIERPIGLTGVQEGAVREGLGDGALDRCHGRQREDDEHAHAVEVGT